MSVSNLLLPFNRNNGSVAQSTVSTAVTTLTVGAAVTGGWYTGMLRLPPAVDVTKPIDVVLTVTPQANSLVDGQNVVFNVIWASIDENGVRVDNTFNQTWPVPNGWLTTDTQHVLMDNGNGHTFDADTFDPQMRIALILRRVGASPLDTFAQGLHLCTGAELRFQSRYPWLVVASPI
jgi:hypothetical protein